MACHVPTPLSAKRKTTVKTVVFFRWAGRWTSLHRPLHPFCRRGQSREQRDSIGPQELYCPSTTARYRPRTQPAHNARGATRNQRFAQTAARYRPRTRSAVLHTFYPFHIDFTIHIPRQTAQKIHGNAMEPAVNPQGNFRFSTTLLFLYQNIGILSTFPPVGEIFFGFSAILPKFHKLVMMKSRK